MDHKASISPVSTRQGSRVGLVGLWMLFLLFLYVLSPGPVVKYIYDGSNHQRAIEQFYAPLQWTLENVPGAGPFYDWYFKVWGIIR